MFDFKKKPVCGENFTLVEHDVAHGGVVEDRSINVVLPHPLFLNNLVHNPTIKNIIQVKFVQIVKTVLA